MTDAALTLHRRAFLARMSAALAAAGLGCPEGDPPEAIVPYAREPGLIVPGAPLFFASNFNLGARAYGVLVETHEGRPTKIEGQPAHPSSLGATDAFGQALVRELYDVNRSTGVREGKRESTWTAFLRAARARLGRDARAAILTGATTSLTLADAIARLHRALPRTRWHVWEPVHDDNATAGLAALLGDGAAPSHHLRIDRARVVLSLDDDFLADAPGRLRHARALALRRRPALGPDGALRLYTVESFPTITGAVSDHRRALRIDAIPDLADRLLRGLMGEDPGDPWLAAVIADLRAAGAQALVLAGRQQPPRVHAIAHAVNHLLGAAGTTIVYTRGLDVGPALALASLRALLQAIDRGEVDALFILDCNPVYTAPADLDVAAAIARVPFTVHGGLYRDETGERTHWHVPLAHPLEAWGDARADEGTITLQQPTIRPLHGGMTAAEVITALAGETLSGRDLLARALADAGYPLAPAALERAIHDGRIPDTEAEPVATALDTAALRALIDAAPAAAAPPAQAPGEGSLVVAIRPDPTIWDGRFYHNPWLQELPKPITGLCWGNAAFVDPTTAAALGLGMEDRAAILVGERRVEASIYVLPGHPPGQVTVHLGYGKEAPAGGEGLGFDAYRLRTSESLWMAPGALLEPLGGQAPLIRGRARDVLGPVDDADNEYARAATREAYARRGAFAFAGRGLPDPPGARPPSLHPNWPTDAHAWAMSIDLTACVGCGACVVACQAENNIPSVGPREAARDRIMHWIRIDTYASDDGALARWRFQPVPCMHCEHAPCEIVCPTGATQHSHDGLNDMVYNRCVGTRYCSNNCPYKVRRFNFFRYSEPEHVSLRLQRNPEVTVRSHGVMEKCTYCVQRIRNAEIRAIREHRPIAMGEVVTACQAACPADAIHFGDLTDARDPVVHERQEARAYALLSELGARPRTTYLGRLEHPNPALIGPAREEGGA